MTADEIHAQLQKEIADLDRRLHVVESQQIVEALHALSRQITHMETTIMALKDDVAALATAIDTLITAFQTAQGNVAQIVAQAVADDEAGTDVPIKAMTDKITAAMTPVAAPLAALKSASAKAKSSS